MECCLTRTKKSLICFPRGKVDAYYKIPSSVTRIGAWAFQACYSLTNITIPDSVVSIGEAAFVGCKGLTDFTVDTENRYYTAEDGVLFNKDRTTLICFPGGKMIHDYNIPSSVTNIGDYAFSCCIKLTNVLLPGSVSRIGYSAFDQSSLESVTIPGSVSSIGEGTFGGCPKLAGIIVDDKNARYASVDGVLFNKRKTSLLCFPGGKGNTRYDVPAGVTSIEDDAFWSCNSLVSVTIPDSVVSVKARAFWGCNGLTSVTIPNNVTSIGDFAFRNCANLTDVYYSGTEEQWKAVTIGSNNEPPHLRHHPFHQRRRGGLP